jgi:hypothetical protein
VVRRFLLAPWAILVDEPRFARRLLAISRPTSTAVVINVKSLSE